MYRVVKRDNSVAEFDIKKISEAIIKAFEATEKQYNNSVIDLLALKVTADFEPKIKDGLIARGGHTGQRGGGAEPGGLCRRGQGLHTLPQAAGEAAQYEVHHT